MTQFPPLQSSYLILALSAALAACSPEAKAPPEAKTPAKDEAPAAAAVEADDASATAKSPPPQYEQPSWITKSSESKPGDKPPRRVLAGLYDKDDDCALGKEQMYLYYDAGQSCYAWSRNVSEGVGEEVGEDEVERDNSAGDFKCFKDLLCFTEYTHNDNCGSEKMVTHKRLTNSCAPDENTGMFIRLLGGTEDCPELPEGANLEKLCPQGIVSRDGQPVGDTSDG